MSVPTAVVVTERDRLVPADRQRGLAQQIPEAKVVRLDGNHMVFLTQPQALADAVHEACRLVSAEPFAGGPHARAAPVALAAPEAVEVVPAEVPASVALDTAPA